MSEAVIIRAMIAADALDLCAAVAVLQAHEVRLHRTRLPAETVAEAYCAWMLQQNAAGAVLIAESDGVFAGFIACRVETKHNPSESASSNRFGYISDLCVLPDFRRRGVARHLMRAAAAHLRPAGITRLRVGALAANAEALALYRALGFRPYEMLLELELDAQEPPDGAD